MWFLHIAGSLSARMQIKGNLWLDVWEAAKPVPARRQKLLFDDRREAEKVLHFLESQKLSAVVELLLPALTHAAICRLLQEQKDDLPTLSESFRHIIKIAERATQNPRPTLQQYNVNNIAKLRNVFFFTFNFIPFISDHSKYLNIL
jgi:Rab3 GTPase-activating protein catalytic subunit